MRILWILGCGLLLSGGAAQAQKSAPTENDADRKPAIVTRGDCFIKGGTILTVTQGVIKDGAILTRNGKIVAIGRNLTAPGGAVVIDATGKFITPGIIDAHSHIAMDSTNEGGDSITAEVRVHDILDPDSLSIYRGLSSGVTASLILHGSANAIGGQSAVVKMKWHRPVEELFVPDAPRMIKFALGENPKRSNRFSGRDGRALPRLAHGRRSGVSPRLQRSAALHEGLGRIRESESDKRQSRPAAP